MKEKIFDFVLNHVKIEFFLGITTALILIIYEPWGLEMKYSEVLEKNIFGIKIGFILELLCWIFVICIFIVVIKKMGSWLPKWNTERKKKNQLQKMRSKTKDLSEEEKKILRGVFVYRAVKIDSLVENIEGVQKLKDKNIISFYRPLNDNVNRYEIDHEWFNFLNNNRNLLEIDSDSL